MTRFIRRSLFVATLALSTVSLVGPAVAGPSSTAAAGAKAFLEGKTSRVRALLQTPASADREKKLDDELSSLIDYDEMAKTALGAGTKDDFYKDRSKEDLAQFTGLLHQLIEKNYKKRITDTLKYQITFGEEQAKDGDTIVPSTAKNTADPKAEPVKIDYVVRKKGGSFIVVDIITEDSSMARTYAKEFKKVIHKDGWNALINKMKDRLAKT